MKPNGQQGLRRHSLSEAPGCRRSTSTPAVHPPHSSAVEKDSSSITPTFRNSATGPATRAFATEAAPLPVNRSLLNELYAELHWDADEPGIVVRATVSKTVQELGKDPESPFYRRIQMSDEPKSASPCISLGAFYGAIEKKGFHIVKEKHGHVVEYGPLWAGDREETLKRTTFVLKGWFNLIRRGARDWWDKGSGDGGGLAMNDGIVACINVLRSVLDHLDASGNRLVQLDNQDLLECIGKYGEALGHYLGSLSDAERRQFRNYRGVQGQTRRMRECQRAIRNVIPDFNPPGLDDWEALQKLETNRKAKELVDRIEVMLQNLTVDELRREFGPDESQWWVMGVPKSIRLKVTQRHEDDDGKRGGRECYFDLLDYRKIATSNWSVFQSLLAYGKKAGKEAGTQWMEFVNEQRRLVAHPSSGASISLAALSQLQEYEEWLTGQLGNPPPESETGHSETSSSQSTDGDDATTLD